MIRSYYRSPYIQRGYGLGGMFRGLAKLFRPLVRKISTTINRPEVRNVLKTMGKETLNTGSELLIDSLKGNDIESKLDSRINLAKKRIVDSIEEGINTRKRTREAKKYQRLLEDKDNNIAANSKTYVKRPPPIKIIKYHQLNEDNDFQDISNKRTKRKTPPSFENSAKDVSQIGIELFLINQVVYCITNKIKVNLVIIIIKLFFE